MRLSPPRTACCLVVLCLSVRAWHTEPVPQPSPGVGLALLLECEPAPEQRPAAVAGYTTVWAESRELAEGESLTADAIVRHLQGHADSHVVVEFQLPAGLRGGLYTFGTSFTMGGVDTQRFVVTVVHGGEGLERPALECRTRNIGSWQKAWYPDLGSILLLPGDRLLRVEATGRASGAKLLDAFILRPAALLPAGMAPADGLVRARVHSVPQGNGEAGHVYILEGDDVAAGTRLFQGLAAAQKEGLLKEAVIEHFIGAEGQTLAAELGVADALPGLVLTDRFHKATGILASPSSADAVRQFCAKPSIPQWIGQPIESVPVPLRDHSPAGWLVAGPWAGKAGLSLWGLDAEQSAQPAPGDPCHLLYFDGATPSQWREAATKQDGVCVVEPETGNYVWPSGTGYAALYLHAERQGTVRLHTAHTGYLTAGWLDGQALPFANATDSPLAKAALRPVGTESDAEATGVTDQGNTLRVAASAVQVPQMTELSLDPGWHRLLLKFVMKHRKGERFAFASQLAADDTTWLRTSAWPHRLDRQAHATAARCQAICTVNGPANLPAPGTPLDLTIDINRRYGPQAGASVVPLIPFAAELHVTVTDYAGHSLASMVTSMTVPGQQVVDLGLVAKPGYYAVHSELRSPQGEPIHVFPPDGFSVVGGTAAQQERKLRKKMAVVYYFMNQDYRDTYFPWMKRMGILRNVGSHHGFHSELWDAAKESGILLATDFWDIWSSQKQADKQELARQTAPYTRWYKSMNEIDIIRQRPTPERWVERTRWEYEAAKAARPDAVYVGGSLVRVGVDDWFRKCLELGLDRYQDVWDVHAYPQTAPRLDGSISNSPNETELGVLKSYAAVGRINTKPFWLGETGARASHGMDGRRWQAETVAKMVAWANARSDFEIIGFLIPWQYSRATKHTMNDIEAGHMPAEAAYYTASALIDGLPCRKVKVEDKQVQAAYFGGTLMLWTTGPATTYTFRPGTSEPWLAVTCVGRTRPLPVDETGLAALQINSAPIYVLPSREYVRLTRE